MKININILNELKNLVPDNNWLEQKKDIEPYLKEERGKFTGISPLLLKPSNTDQVSNIVKYCFSNNLSLVPQGGRTGLCGGAVPSNKGNEIMISLEKLNKIREIDRNGSYITAESGCILSDIQSIAKKSSRFFPLSLASEGSCTIGGNISTNAGGVNVLKYGMTRELVLGLEVVFANGKIWNGLRSIKKDNRGYSLKNLFIGAEGTLGIITACVLKLFPFPKNKETAIVALENPKKIMDFYNLSFDEYGDLINAFELNSSLGMEIVKNNIDNTKNPFNTNYPWYLIIEMSSSYSHNLKQRMNDLLIKADKKKIILNAIQAQNISQASEIWKTREFLNEAQKKEGASIKHDISIPINSIEIFIKKAVEKISNYLPGAKTLVFGHFADGNLHFNIGQPNNISKDNFIKKTKDVNNIVFELVKNMNGSFSAEHGIGQLKKNELREFSPSEEINAMKLIKESLDPKNIMNPGKII